MANKDNSISLNVNEKIRACEVRLIGADGGNVGIVSFNEALDMAR